MNIKPQTTVKITTVLTALMVAGMRVVAQGNFVVNGAFDTDASGWTLDSGAFYNSLFGNPSGCVGLYYSSGSGTASQEINSLTPGQFYTVSGDYYGGAGAKNGVTNGFGVALDGIFLFETNATTSSSWYAFSFSWQATATNALLSLSAPINGTGYRYNIDNLAVYAVPEPGSLCLLGLGAWGFLWQRRKVKAVQ